MMADSRIIVGDCEKVLRGLPEKSVHCCVTSPPYWGLRNYGVDGAIGLEATPDEYVAKLVDVFREVWRVLRDDGTCWVNLGDSYAQASARGSKCNSTHDEPDPNFDRGGRYTETATVSAKLAGLKPKDLCGMPWSVAKALQAPYYTGQIQSKTDRVWLAAIIDGEGTICGFHHKRKDDGRIRTGVHIAITNTNRDLLNEAYRIWPTSREDHNPHGKGHRGSLPIWRWVAHGASSKALLMRELYPHLVAKKRQALLAYNLLTFQSDGKRLGRSALGDEIREKRALLTRLLSKANHQISVDVPSWCVEPPPLFEPGWYLRSDIIWAKKNPMPESCTDRPTKAHEYVFLLTKKSRYFYDGEAVRETAEYGYREQKGEIRSVAQDGRRHTTGTTRGANPSTGRNRRTVWSIPEDEWSQFLQWRAEQVRQNPDVWKISTEAFSQAHFATFPRKLVAPCIMAGVSSKGCCPECGAPWVRVVEKDRVPTRPGVNTKIKVPGGWDTGEGAHGSYHRDGRGKPEYRDVAEIGNRDPERHVTESRTVGWEPGCKCVEECPTYGDPRDYDLPPDPVPCTVLDPFAGAGTTGVVAKEHGLNFIGIELNPEYAKLAKDRIANPESLTSDDDCEGQLAFSYGLERGHREPQS